MNIREYLEIEKNERIPFTRIKNLNMDEIIELIGDDFEYIDFSEGCLQDNFLIATDNEIIAVYEQYLNSGSSCLQIEIATSPCPQIWDNWEGFVERNDSYDDCYAIYG